METPFILLVKKVLGSVLLVGARPCQQRPSVNPDHNRQGSLLVVFWAVHIEEEAILLPLNFPWVVPRRLLGAGNCGLRGHVPKTLVGMVRLRCQEPEWLGN